MLLLLGIIMRIFATVEGGYCKLPAERACVESHLLIDADIVEKKSSLHHRLPLPGPLFGKDDAAHLQDTLETLTALESILLESRHQGIFDAVLDSLPAAAQGGDAGGLDKLCLVLAQGLVDDLLLDVDEIAPRQILADHRESLVAGVDIGCLEDVAYVHRGAHYCLDPFRRGLLAGDEALGAEDACLGVDGAGEGVDCDNVLRLVVPRAIFAPVGRGHLVPGVVVCDGVGKDLHCE